MNPVTHEEFKDMEEDRLEEMFAPCSYEGRQSFLSSAEPILNSSLFSPSTSGSSGVQIVEKDPSKVMTPQNNKDRLRQLTRRVLKKEVKQMKAALRVQEKKDNELFLFRIKDSEALKKKETEKFLEEIKERDERILEEQYALLVEREKVCEKANKLEEELAEIEKKEKMLNLENIIQKIIRRRGGEEGRFCEKPRRILKLVAESW